MWRALVRALLRQVAGRRSRAKGLPRLPRIFHTRRRNLNRSAGFPPAVSPTSSRQTVQHREVSGLEIRDTAGWKPALLRLDSEASLIVSLQIFISPPRFLRQSEVWANDAKRASAQCNFYFSTS